MDNLLTSELWCAICRQEGFSKQPVTNTYCSTEQPAHQSSHWALHSLLTLSHSNPAPHTAAAKWEPLQRQSTAPASKPCRFFFASLITKSRRGNGTHTLNRHTQKSMQNHKIWLIATDFQINCIYKHRLFYICNCRSILYLSKNVRCSW